MSNHQGDSKPKHPGGRPTLYRPEFCELLITHMSEGRAFETFPALLKKECGVKVDRATLYNWAKAHPEFFDAKKHGQDLSAKYWEDLLINHVVNVTESGYDELGNKVTKSKSMNASVWIFAMKNRFGWRDNVEPNTDGPDDNSSELSPSMTKAQALELLHKKKEKGDAS